MVTGPLAPSDPITSSDAAVHQINQRRAKSLSTIVREAIEAMIVGGELSSGDRVNESSLAAHLKVSRGPVREAFRSLEQAGLLVSAVNQGVYVRNLSLIEAKHLYEVRTALACLVGRLVVERADDAEVAIFHQHLADMADAAEREDFQHYYALNLAFHDALVAGAHNRSLEQSYRWIINQLHLCRRKGLVQPGNLQVSNAEHTAIVDAIAKRDAGGAEAAMGAHIQGGWQRLSVLL